MRPQAERGVHLLEHQGTDAQPSVDWDNARVFLEVARCGSFRSASERLGLSINVVRRRVDDFERQIGATLITRDVLGARLTDEGTKLVSAVERMEAASFDLMRARGLVSPHQMQGEVRVAVTEGLGTFWLAPRLVEFQRTFPSILVDLHCAMQSADVLRHETDIAIQLVKPTTLDVKIVKLGRLHIMFYASQKYIDTYGKPASYEELTKHRIVMQFADQTAAKDIFDSWFPGIQQQELLVMKNNVSSANYWAIAKGAGIGLLPTYASAIGAKVVPIDVGLHRAFDIWLSYHPASRSIPRISHMIDWIIEAFNPVQFPWFRDEFIHPNDLPKSYKGEPLVNLFEGFAAD